MSEAKPVEDKTATKLEEKTEEKQQPPFPSIVLSVDIHCVGCAKKVERCLMKCREVEEVDIDKTKNQVIVKGIVAEPEALCMKIHKKTHRMAKVMSPLPTIEEPAQPSLVPSQVSCTNTVVLQTNLHCRACANYLKRKILKMKGVQSAETELGTGKVVVTGTMDGTRLVDYIYRRSRKLAKIVSLHEEEKAQTKAVKEHVKPQEEGPKINEEKQREEMDKVIEEREESKAEKIVETIAEECYYDGIGMDILYWPPAYAVGPVSQLFGDENPNYSCIS